MGTDARARRVAAAALAAIALAVLTGCSGSGSSSASRATLYDSVEGLAADSSAIVVGTVTHRSRDGSATVASVEVDNAPANPQLGANLDGEYAPVAVGDVVEVRQDAEPLLADGTEYLLFLTPTMLPGDAASQYFVTGAVAGLYERDGDEFRRVVPDSGDTLPETFSIAGEDG